MEIIGFGPMDFEEYGFWTGLIDHAIPFATAQHALIQRPGSTPVFGTPIINERRIPVQIGWRGGGGFSSVNDAWNGLMAALRPTDPTPRELRARRDDGTLVALTAVVEVPAGVSESVNIINVTFITTDLEWVALTEVFQFVTFSDPLDQAFLLSAALVSEDPGRIMLSPTVQRTGAGPQYGATFHRSITLTNNAPEPLVNFPVLIPIGSTTALVSGSKALASGDDFRVIVDGLEIPRTLKGWNTASTGVWVVLPNLPVGETITFDFISGNPDMGSPTILSYPNQPPYDLANSTNDALKFKTEDIAANAGLGIWHLTSGTVEPQIDTGVPGAWQMVTTKGAVEDFTQARSTQYVDTDTYYRSTFQGRRSKAGGISPQNNRNGDGIVYHSPLPIESINFGYQYRNDREGVEGSLPVGLFVLLARVGIESWAPLHTNSTEEHGGWATVAAATYTPDDPVSDIALAVWPYNQVAVRAGTVTGREINVFVDTDITLNRDDSGLVWGSLSAETEIYEFAERIVTYEDGTNRIARIVLLGAESGGRLFIPLGNTLVIDGLFRTVEEWNADADTFIRTIPPTSYRVLQGISPDTGFSVLEVASDVWPNPTPPANVIPNSSFDTDVAGWSRRGASPGITTTGPTHEGTTVKTAPGALKTVISASTGGIGTSVLEQLTAKLAINGQYVVTVSAYSRTNDDELVPRLGIGFFDGNNTHIEDVYEEVYTPIADAWRRRIVSVVIPDGAISYQPLLQTYTRVANATGTVFWDDVVAGGAEIVLLHRADDEPGTIVMSYATYPSFL